MATSVQTLPLTRGPSKNFRNPFPAPPLSSRCSMGSVGSLVERPDVSPTKGSRAVPQVRPKQTNGLLKKGFAQRELLNYLNITRWAPCKNPDLHVEKWFTRYSKTCQGLTSDTLLVTGKSLKQAKAVKARRTSSLASAPQAAERRRVYTPRCTVKTALKSIWQKTHCQVLASMKRWVSSFCIL